MNTFKSACQVICTLQASFWLAAVINPMMLVITQYSKGNQNKLATGIVVDTLACIKIHFISTFMCFLGFPASSLIFSARLFFVMMIPIWLIGFWSKNSSMKPCNSWKKKIILRIQHIWKRWFLHLKVKPMQLDWVPETDSSSVREITSGMTATKLLRQQGYIASHSGKCHLSELC